MSNFKALLNNLVGVNLARNVEVSKEALISCLHLKREMVVVEKRWPFVSTRHTCHTLKSISNTNVSA